MRKKLLSCAAFVGAAAAILGATPASALTYVTQLEYTDAGGKVASLGAVTVEEVDAFNVKVTVSLNDTNDIFVDTGAHYAFTWNMADTPNSTTTLISPLGGDGPFTPLPEGAYVQTGAFGTFTNAFQCCGKGASNGKTPPLIFNVYNASGLTFAGVGATFDGDGKLLTQGTGNRFTSNTTGTAAGFTGGWWFAADILDRNSPTDKGATYLVGGRDAFCVGEGCGGGNNNTVPEPGTWALMILGFGGAGMMLRRRKHAIA